MKTETKALIADILGVLCMFGMLSAAGGALLFWGLSQ